MACHPGWIFVWWLNRHLLLLKGPPPEIGKRFWYRDSHYWREFIGGVHKIRIFIRDFPKEIFQNFPEKKRNFNNKGGLLTPGSGYSEPTGLSLGAPKREIEINRATPRKIFEKKIGF